MHLQVFSVVSKLYSFIPLKGKQTLSLPEVIYVPKVYECFQADFMKQYTFNESILTPSVVAPSAVKMEYIHTLAFVSLDGLAAYVKQTLT